jgi:hypothetical protein
MAFLSPYDHIYKLCLNMYCMPYYIGIVDTYIR